VGGGALELIPIIYCMAHVVQLKTIQNPTINCSEKRSKFLRSGKWHEEQLSSSQKACNQRTSAASFPRPSVFSFSQTKTKLSMGLCHPPTPNSCIHLVANVDVDAPLQCECVGCLWKQFPLVSAIKKQYHLEST